MTVCSVTKGVFLLSLFLHPTNYNLDIFLIFIQCFPTYFQHAQKKKSLC